MKSPQDLRISSRKVASIYGEDGLFGTKSRPQLSTGDVVTILRMESCEGERERHWKRWSNANNPKVQWITPTAKLTSLESSIFCSSRNFCRFKGNIEKEKAALKEHLENVSQIDEGDAVLLHWTSHLVDTDALRLQLYQGGFTVSKKRSLPMHGCRKQCHNVLIT